MAMDGRGSWQAVVRRRRALAGLAAVALCVFGCVALAYAVGPSESLVQRFPKLVGPAGQTGRFGSSVALSGDGNTGLVGSPDSNAGGVALVVSRSGEGAWQEGTQLRAPEAEDGGAEACNPPVGDEGEECRAGRSVALSSDGSTAIVGAPAKQAGRGAAWVFVRSGSTWTLAATLSGGLEETPEGHFGRTVALSSDGSTAIVGAPANRAGRGAAWVFQRSRSGWEQSGVLLSDSDGTGEVHFGGGAGSSE